VIPFEGHTSQSKLMQDRVLSIMGMKGAENISKYLDSITAEKQMLYG